MISFAPGTTLEEAVAQTPPHLRGYPYYWTVAIEGNRGISSAVFADESTDWHDRVALYSIGYISSSESVKASRKMPGWWGRIGQ